MIKINPAAQRVLLIEDNTLTMKILESQFVQHGFQVFKASDGQSGLELVQNEAFDLILVDLNIPLISGKQLIKMIRKEVKNDKTLIYAMSAGIDEKLGESLLKLGFNGYLNKPVKLIQKADNKILVGQ